MQSLFVLLLAITENVLLREIIYMILVAGNFLNMVSIVFTKSGLCSCSQNKMT